MGLLKDIFYRIYLVWKERWEGTHVPRLGREDQQTGSLCLLCGFHGSNQILSLDHNHIYPWVTPPPIKSKLNFEHCFGQNFTWKT